MRGAAAQSSRNTWLAAVLALGASLGCNPAQAAGDSAKVAVSAVILSRIACSSAGAHDGQPKCSGSDPRTTFRVRSSPDPQARASDRARGGDDADAVVLSIEP